MPTFSYTARNAQGQQVTGMLTADNQQAAIRALDDRQLFPIQVREGGAASKSMLSGRRKRVKMGHVGQFYGQLADLLKAGVPMMRSLDVLTKATPNPALVEILKEVRDDVAGGDSLADALQKHPHVFDELHVSMVRAGEQGGFLEEVLMRAAAFVERQNELRNKLVGSMVYPLILLTAGLGVVLMMLTVVVPKMRPFLERLEKKGKLPTLTIGLFAVCDFIRDYWMYVIVVLAAGIVMAMPYIRSEAGRFFIDRWKLRLPVIGNIVRIVAICRFCRILGTMLANGVPILQSLKVSKDSAGNLVLAEEIDKAAESVRQGETLARPLGASGMFPPDVIDMIAVAEEANTLDTVLVGIADANEVRAARVIDLAVRLIEPALLVLMAAMVLIIALAILVPILTSSSAMAG
ncbi:MAG: type II secretion system F family protein [Phycisphaerae bacterium]|nr:type II secretion system F family protein [Phycisphaerae bacterium]